MLLNFEKTLTEMLTRIRLNLQFNLESADI